MPFCISCGQENPDVAKFCLACGSPMATAPAAAPAPAPAPVETRVEERRLVTAVFTDIVGSTASAEALDPEDVRARLAPYYVEARRELELHGGSVAKFIGDAVVALFGAPTSHEDDEERAVRAAIAVTKAIEELNATDDWLNLNIRTGINTGEAIVVIGSNPGEEIGEAAGDVMNTVITRGSPTGGKFVSVPPDAFQAFQLSHDVPTRSENAFFSGPRLLPGTTPTQSIGVPSGVLSGAAFGGGGPQLPVCHR